MGPARAYLLPMMKPNTMNTRMMVPATATTAMMMTGFCSLETIAADGTHAHAHTHAHTHTHTHTHKTCKEREKKKTGTLSENFGTSNDRKLFDPRMRGVGGLVTPLSSPLREQNRRRVRRREEEEEEMGLLLFLSRPRTHGSTVSESGLNGPRRRRRCPSSQTKTHSGWIVSTYGAPALPIERAV